MRRGRAGSSSDSRPACRRRDTIGAVTKARIKAAVPMRYKQAARTIFLRLSRITTAGTGVTCPCCGAHLRRFARFHGESEQCPHCESLRRHRALLLYLRDELRVASTGGRVLHFAPEPSLQRWVASLDAVSYVSVDLESPLADVRADITKLPFEDDSFDLVICSHVLEHVPDDRTAIAELFRVVRPRGTAVIQVPAAEVDETLEDPSVTDPAEREQLFGQYDHVRVCGARLPPADNEAAGFDVTEEDYAGRLDAATRARGSGSAGARRSTSRRSPDVEVAGRAARDA